MQVSIRSLLTACFVSSALLGAGVEASAAANPAGSAAEANPRGQILSLSCSSCHGTDGKSSGIIPSFYGKTPEYIESSLMDFKSGKRFSTVMGRHAKGYTDEEIHQIAQYFGTVWKNNK
jgi:sulfide dehydrogenase cytochrome subunit